MAPSSGPGPDSESASREQRPDEDAARPQPELRWVRLREPRQAVEVGANGRVLASRYHDDSDSWAILLETDGREL